MRGVVSVLLLTVSWISLCSMRRKSLAHVRWYNVRVNLYYRWASKTKLALIQLRSSVLNVNVYIILQWFGIDLTTGVRALPESTVHHLEQPSLTCFSWHLAISCLIHCLQIHRIFHECLAFEYIRVPIRKMYLHRRRRLLRLQGQALNETEHPLHPAMLQKPREVLLYHKMHWTRLRARGNYRGRYQAWTRSTKRINQNEKEIMEALTAQQRE
jgi:hypothetical protein